MHKDEAPDESGAVPMGSDRLDEAAGQENIQPKRNPAATYIALNPQRTIRLNLHPLIA